MGFLVTVLSNYLQAILIIFTIYMFFGTVAPIDRY